MSSRATFWYPDFSSEVIRSVLPSGDILAKALQKDRDVRYQSAADMQADLQDLKNSVGKHEDRHTTAPRAKSRARFWAIAATAIAIVAAVSIAAFVRSSHPRAQRLSDQDTIVLATFPIP